ncbi:M23 family metallopeptidase [Photobacterium sanguinicancri]|uniref:M23 family metallopeptidase n=1 Tax=Photobacterium sanguinicancri TaxID=875932 RepID=UPI0026E17B1F|nr:peptidoglycan DD-metalloendopeptidase family protein [Photobacterium sanguinicancri]MDO6499241.1 peptidoglycan DD-metalloendopeptidase family protein [Photobacterium sanguinicancri]
MKERIIISVSTINGSKHFHLGMKAQKRVRYAVVATVAASILTVGSIFYLMNEVDFAKVKQEELEKRSYTLNEELDVLNQLKDELEHDLDERESKLSSVSDRLGELENLLGVDVDDHAPIESRLDVAAINSAVRVAVLDSLPNGAPVKNARQSSQYGKRKHPVTGKVRLHAGLDFAVNIGTPIYAPADGVVETVRPSNKGSGNFIRLQHSFGITSSYSHLSKFAVRGGNFVDKGDLIGYSGNSGLSSGPHLHYEIRFVGRPLNPRPFVDWGMDNFEHIFEKERKIKWVSLINKVEQRVSMQLQLSSQKAVTLQASSS